MSTLAPHPTGTCPSCGSHGSVGEPCPERVCQRQRIHFIPDDFARSLAETASVERESLVGQHVGDFLVLARIGKGGFGRILLALQRPLYRLRAAVKLLEIGERDAATTKRVMDKFENEAAVLAVLNHPNIVRLLHYGTHEDRPFLAMEFVPGGQTLQKVMNRLILQRTTLDPAIVGHLLNQILNGLEAAHRQHIIHRDIKPENIMLHEVVGNAHHLKLLDFGIAKIIEQRRDTSVVIGTVQYMAPEQIEAKNLGPWTDLYAVGCIAFEFITGRRPFDADDPQTIFMQKVSTAYDPVDHLGQSHLPAPVVAFLRKALARKPADRFQSTREMRTALNELFLSVAIHEVFARDLSQTLDPAELGRLQAEERLATETDPGQVEKLAATSALGNPLSPPSAPSAAAFDTGIPELHAPPSELPSRNRRWLWLAGTLAALAGGSALALSLAGEEPRADTAPALASTAPDAPDTSSRDASAASDVKAVGVTPVAPAVSTPEVSPLAATDTSAPEAAAPEPAQRSLKLDSTPSAAVWVDDEARGRTPFDLTWKAGEPPPKVKLVATGYRPHDLVITPADIERGTRVVKLQKTQQTDPGLRLQGKEW